MFTQVQAVLFDLDGTLVDSAPDLAVALNKLLAEESRPPLPYAQLRAMVGSGARGMVGVGFGIGPEHPRFPELRDRFLNLYADATLVHTRVFDDIPQVLDGLRLTSRAWGIVTNKATRFAQPIVNGLGLMPATVVCGDTTAFAKPHPEPLLFAARELGVVPGDILYVGDDIRDIQASRAAGMPVAAAAWGYLGAEACVADWQADIVLESPRDLLPVLGLV